jgi:hypothetical protein
MLPIDDFGLHFEWRSVKWIAYLRLMRWIEVVAWGVSEV